MTQHITIFIATSNPHAHPSIERERDIHNLHEPAEGEDVDRRARPQVPVRLIPELGGHVVLGAACVAGLVSVSLFICFMYVWFVRLLFV